MLVSWKRLVAVARRHRSGATARSCPGKPGAGLTPRCRTKAGWPSRSTCVPARRRAPSAGQSQEFATRIVEPLGCPRVAQFVYPGDFWVESELGHALAEQKHREEAIRFYTAALALRPNSAACPQQPRQRAADQKNWTKPSPTTARPSSSTRNMAAAYNNLGNRLARPEEAGRGHRLLQEGHRIRPDNRHGLPDQPRPRSCATT